MTIEEEVQQAVEDFKIEMDKELFDIRPFTEEELEKVEAEELEWRNRPFYQRWWNDYWVFGEWRRRLIGIWNVLTKGQCDNCDPGEW